MEVPKENYAFSHALVFDEAMLVKMLTTASFAIVNSESSEKWTYANAEKGLYGAVDSLTYANAVKDFRTSE